VSFRARFALLCCAVVLLLAALLLGAFLSPERVQARTEARPLLPLLSAKNVDEIIISDARGPVVTLKRQGAGWVAPREGLAYPASTARITDFLRTVAGLARGRGVTSDPAHLPELGLDQAGARRLVLRQPGAELRLLVGKRASSGDEDYVMVEGEPSVHLVRGSLAFYLSQDRSSWYELHVLPDDVMGETISAISVSGSLAIPGSGGEALRGPYSISRGSGKGPWAMTGEASAVSGGAASGMATALAMLEGSGFAAPGQRADHGRLLVEVSTKDGKKYALTVRAGAEQGTAAVTTTWSPWTYVVNELPLRRAILPRAGLLGQR
jgi:hypothetical protein